MAKEKLRCQLGVQEQREARKRACGAVTFNLKAKGICALTRPEHGSLILKTCSVTGTSPLADTFTLGGSSAIIPETPPGTPTTS